MKQVIIAVIVIVGIIGGAVLISGGDESSGSVSNNFYGQEEGIVTVTEYADFQCPGCSSFLPIVTEVKEQFKDQVRFEFKHFPIVTIHPNSVAAHRAAEAAGRQGKFWEMHNELFAQQRAWASATNPADIFRSYAERLELDMEQYDAEVNSSDVLDTINADTAQGKDLGVSGTPSFFIDNVEIENPTTTINTAEAFAERIQAAIDAKNGVEPSSESSESESTNSEEAIPPEDEL